MRCRVNLLVGCTACQILSATCSGVRCTPKRLIDFALPLASFVFAQSGMMLSTRIWGCGRNLGEIFRMTNIRYTNAQRLKALEVFDRTQSATKTVRELGYPGRWTLHRWIRQRSEPPSPPIRRTTLKRYPLTTKLKAVELFNSGMSPDAVAVKLSLNSKMSVSCLGPTIP